MYVCMTKFPLCGKESPVEDVTKTTKDDLLMWACSKVCMYLCMYTYAPYSSFIHSLDP
jgi:hypothetical protein